LKDFFLNDFLDPIGSFFNCIVTAVFAEAWPKVLCQLSVLCYNVKYKLKAQISKLKILTQNAKLQFLGVRDWVQS
jgi:hypothetical protein